VIRDHFEYSEVLWQRPLVDLVLLEVVLDDVTSSLKMTRDSEEDVTSSLNVTRDSEDDVTSSLNVTRDSEEDLKSIDSTEDSKSTSSDEELFRDCHDQEIITDTCDTGNSEIASNGRQPEGNKLKNHNV
jgi:hypothetical protein